MELIGTGAFSKVYRQGNDRHVHIKTNDAVKECMAMGWFPSSRLFPKVQESTELGYDYMMTYYPKQRSLKESLKPSEYQKYKDLRRVFNNLAWRNCDYNNVRAAFKTIKSRTLRTHLLDALDALTNYGSDIGFEISPRNVAVSPAGNLVLLDCFFMGSQLEDVRRAA